MTAVAEHPAAHEIAPPSGLVRRTMQGLWRHQLARVSIFVLAILAALAVFADVLAPRGPFAIDYTAVLQPPSATYVLGTDAAGRDVLARLLTGARVSLAVGLVAVLIAQVVGIALGAIAGYYGGRVDQLIMRTTDVVMCFPALVLMLVVAAAFGAGLSRTMVVIGAISWPPIARLVRGQILSLRERDFIIASRTIGVRDRDLFLRHLLPNVLPYVIVSATFGVAEAILLEAALSFLGLGVPIPVPSWGNMLTDAQSLSVLTLAPWLWVPPGLLVAITVLAITFTGDGLRDALDPRTASR
jgi:peptide/nickel transport system permease protein